LRRCILTHPGDGAQFGRQAIAVGIGAAHQNLASLDRTAAAHGVGQHPAARDRTLGVLRGRRRRILSGERRRCHANDARQRNHAPESGEAISTSGAHDHMAPSMPMGRSK